MKQLLCPFVCFVVLLSLSGCGGVSGGSSAGNNPSPSPTPTPAPAATATLQNSVNHIIILAQENRSFDHYFVHLMQYWQKNGYPQATNGTTFDGMPDTASNVGDPPAGGGPAPTITAFALNTVCVENPSPSWNESHIDFNKHDPLSTTFVGDGFAQTAGHEGPINDVIGARVMGYYTGDNLNYYYFMASNFATSDRWFSPVMSRTSLNRMYLLGGTSQGHAYPLQIPEPQLSGPVIFQLLQQKGVSWKIYVHPDASGCATASCLYAMSYVQNFMYGNTILQQFPQNIVPTSQFITDAQSGTLPQVAMIEPPSNLGLDEHPADDDSVPCCSVQAGAHFVSSLVNTLMTGPSWKDSAFILTWDEYGGFYDHVPPQPTVSPDGIKPLDLIPGDVCTIVNGPTCDFTYTGMRVPLIVISPFTKRHYVSHTTSDYTAILKFIETRFGLSNLSARDAAQMDMTEFFDFSNPPWMTPPAPQVQDTSKPCYLDHLP